MNCIIHRDMRISLKRIKAQEGSQVKIKSHFYQHSSAFTYSSPLGGATGHLPMLVPSSVLLVEFLSRTSFLTACFQVSLMESMYKYTNKQLTRNTVLWTPQEWGGAHGEGGCWGLALFLFSQKWNCRERESTTHKVLGSWEHEDRSSATEPKWKERLEMEMVVHFNPTLMVERQRQNKHWGSLVTSAV